MAPTALRDAANYPISNAHHSMPNGTGSRNPCSCQNAKSEPIAVIGFSLKFPQEATTPDAFWEMLKSNRCAMTEWPKDRLNIDAFYHADNKRTDTVQPPFLSRFTVYITDNYTIRSRFEADISSKSISANSTRPSSPSPPPKQRPWTRSNVSSSKPRTELSRTVTSSTFSSSILIPNSDNENSGHSHGESF